MDVSQVLNVMRSGSLPFQLSRWARLVALVLAGTMLLQSGPVRLLVQSAGQTWAEKPCRHHAEQTVCPRNPDGPCTCTHHDSENTASNSDSPAGPAFEACDGGGATALSPSTSPLAWSPIGTIRPTPRVADNGYPSLSHALSPQRLGDEVFRPPRTTPPVRLT